MCLFSFLLKWDHSSHRTFIESEIFYNLKIKWNILHASFSLLAKMQGYISLKNSALRHCVGVLKSWFKLQKQNYWVFLLAVNPSFLVFCCFFLLLFLLFVQRYFLSHCLLLPNTLWTGFCHGNLSCIWAIQFAYSWAFGRLCWYCSFQWKEAYPYSRWRASGWSNHWTCSSRVVSVYTLFFAVFQ